MKTEDIYRIFEKNQDAVKASDNFTEFCNNSNHNHLLNYAGYWVEDAFHTFKAGKRTYKPLMFPYASKYSELFSDAVLISSNSKDRPIDSKYLGGESGFSKHLGGIRGWSKSTPDIRSHSKCEFYGTYVKPLEAIHIKIGVKSYSFEAVKRTDGILITVSDLNYIGCSWLALLDPSEDIRTLFDDNTKAFLESEHQAAVSAWGIDATY